MKHIEMLLCVDSKTEIREKKYFGKFDRKLTFTFPLIKYGQDIKDFKKVLEEISVFMKENPQEGTEYMWYKKYSMF